MELNFARLADVSGRSKPCGLRIVRMALEKQVSVVRPAPIKIVAVAVLGATTLFASGVAVGAMVRQSHQSCSGLVTVDRHFAIGPNDSFAPLRWRQTSAASSVAPQWANRIVAASSQYSTTSWSAAQALGAPDVYPNSGDNANAWASLTADGSSEYIEVAFEQPQLLQGVQIAETFNPGAIGKIEGIGSDGQLVVLFEAPVNGALDGKQLPTRLSNFGGGCSPFPIASVRVTLQSGQIAGWNEIDAIGAVACEPSAAAIPTPEPAPKRCVLPRHRD